MVVPNAIIIGAQKAGSTSLFDWIGQHPDVYAPSSVKDTHYFSHHEKLEDNPKFFDEFYPSHKNEKIVLAGDVNYIFQNHVAERLYNYNKNLKLILVLRNPIERAKSAYLYFKQHFQEERSFEQAIEDEFNGKLTTIFEKANFAYIEHGMYFQQINRYLKYFPKSQLHIIIFEEMMLNKENVIKNCFDFLGVESNFTPQWTYENKTGSSKSTFISKYILKENPIKDNLKKLTGFDKIVSYETRVKLINLIQKLNTSSVKPQASFNFPTNIINQYKKERELLSTLTNSDLNKYWHFE